MQLAKLFKEQDRGPEPWAKLLTSEGLLEGGSCGLFYGASLLRGDAIDNHIGRAFKVVLKDERGHGPANLFNVNKYVLTEKDLDGAMDMLKARAELRLRMRNEQFSYPLPWKRVSSIINGDVDLKVVKDIWGDAAYKVRHGSLGPSNPCAPSGY